MTEIDGWTFSEDEEDFIATKGPTEARVSKRRDSWFMMDELLGSMVPSWVFDELERRKAAQGES